MVSNSHASNKSNKRALELASQLVKSNKKDKAISISSPSAHPPSAHGPMHPSQCGRSLSLSTSHGARSSKRFALHASWGALVFPFLFLSRITSYPPISGASLKSATASESIPTSSRRDSIGHLRQCAYRYGRRLSFSHTGAEVVRSCASSPSCHGASGPGRRPYMQHALAAVRLSTDSQLASAPLFLCMSPQFSPKELTHVASSRQALSICAPPFASTLGLVALSRAQRLVIKPSSSVADRGGSVG